RFGVGELHGPRAVGEVVDYSGVFSAPVGERGMACRIGRAGEVDSRGTLAHRAPTGLDVVHVRWENGVDHQAADPGRVITQDLQGQITSVGDPIDVPSVDAHSDG